MESVEGKTRGNWGVACSNLSQPEHFGPKYNARLELLAPKELPKGRVANLLLAEPNPTPGLLRLLELFTHP